MQAEDFIRRFKSRDILINFSCSFEQSVWQMLFPLAFLPLPFFVRRPFHWLSYCSDFPATSTYEVPEIRRLPSVSEVHDCVTLMLT